MMSHPYAHNKAFYLYHVPVTKPESHAACCGIATNTGTFTCAEIEYLHISCINLFAPNYSYNLMIY